MKFVEKIFAASEYHLQIRIPDVIIFSNWPKRYRLTPVNYDVTKP